MKGEDFLMWTILHVMKVTTLTKLKISSFLAPSSVSQATVFFRPPSLGHGVELNMQANLPPLSMLSGERWVCSISSFPGTAVVSVGVAPLILLGSWALNEASFLCKMSSRETSPSLGPPWGLCFPLCWSVNNGGGLCPAAESLLMGNCLDNNVYPFTETHLPCGSSAP